MEIQTTMALQTINRILVENARRFSTDVILHWKPAPGGGFEEMTWGRLAGEALAVAAGLQNLGISPGDRLAILAANRLEWLLADLGALLAGAVVVPVHDTDTAEQCLFVLRDAGARFVVVENSAQLEKVLSGMDALPALERIILLDGPSPAGDPRQVTLHEVLADGKGADPQRRRTIEETALSLSPEQLATLVYTSGATGPPKGCMISHGNIGTAVGAMDQLQAMESRTDLSMLVLPLSHFYPRVYGYYFNLFKNIPLAIAASVDTMAADMAAIRPTYFCGVPHTLATIRDRIAEEARARGWLSRAFFNRAVMIGKIWSACHRMRRPVPLLLIWQYRLAKTRVLDPIRQRLGGRLDVVISTGAPLPPEVGEFVNAAGIRVIEFYGLSESLGAAMTRPDECRFGTGGKAMPGFGVRLDNDGEILVRGNRFMGYWNNPQKTAEVMEDDWCRTGDVGYWEGDYLRVTDRKSDLITTSGGHRVSPRDLERRLIKAVPMVSDAMVCGAGKPYLTVLITLDPTATETFAAARGIQWESFDELTRHPDVRKAIQGAMDPVNADAPRHQIMRKFDILPQAFSLENGELTPMRTLRRAVVRKSYKDRIEALYGSETAKA